MNILNVVLCYDNIKLALALTAAFSKTFHFVQTEINKRKIRTEIFENGWFVANKTFII